MSSSVWEHLQGISSEEEVFVYDQMNREPQLLFSSASIWSAQSTPIGTDVASIETVSQSERGFERAYQGTALVFVWRLQLNAAAQQLELRLEA